MDEADPSSAYSFQSARLLPEIRIDTSRLDGLLSGFQRRLTALESSFAKVAESAAEAAHKVGVCVVVRVQRKMHIATTVCIYVHYVPIPGV